MPEASVAPTAVEGRPSASAEFPRDLLSLLRCSRDAGELELSADARSGSIGIIDGRLTCKTCTAEYRIQGGIACMLAGSLTPEDQHEMALIDGGHGDTFPDRFVPPSRGWRSPLWDRLEIPPHLSAMAPLNNCKVLEIACGDGRFTLLMARMGAQVLAVDFSLNALRKLAWWMRKEVVPTTCKTEVRRSWPEIRSRVGLVQADASHFHLAPRSFERALSASPLDSRDERMRMYHAIADALTDDGCYVGGVEHDWLLRRLLGMPMARRYTANGIFIEHFDMTALHHQIVPYFNQVRVRPIRPFVPLINKLPLPLSVWGSRFIGALPVFRHLGQILLWRAERPVRPPVEDALRPGNPLVKALLKVLSVFKLDKFLKP